MDIIGSEGAYVAETARAWLDRKRPAPFDELPAAVQRRVVRLQLFARGLPAEFDTVELLRLGEGPVSLGTLFWVSRDAAGELHVREGAGPEFEQDRVMLELGGTGGKTEFAGVEISWRQQRRHGDRLPKQPTSDVEYFDADRVGRRICLRHWRPGDRFQPIGMAGSAKLQDLFINGKVPRAQRHELVVATASDGRLFWVEGLRIAEGFKLRSDTTRRLRWEWRRRTAAGQ
jgi:tRNA(Ile)-lysidine synthase